jgi:ubiquinone/menaquinone biosynthesis C-methylase UbiE
VLEIGVGSGLNFGFYNSNKVNHIYALDPSEEMWLLAKKQISKNRLQIEFVKGFAEEIPIEESTIDSIVITYTLCTITDLNAAFSEFRRVLKPRGKLIFCEHGISPDKSVQRWQNILNPIWKKFGGGCNLNRNIPQLIKNGSFKIETLDTMYIPGFKPACFNYWGTAEIR